MKKYGYIAILLTLTTLSVCGQVMQDSMKIGRSTVFEKVYLHIDRQLYAPHETIWIKAYIVSGVNHTLLYGHKNLYIQLIDEEGKIYKDLLLLTEDGMASGEFRLPYIMEEGQYTIRAYTRYLENFGEKHYFHKKIWVSKSIKEKEDEQQDTLAGNDIEVGFYPESGNLLMNSANRIAFKVMDSHGRGVAVSGTIIDETGAVVTPFSTSYLGMGSFLLMPKQGKTYTALLMGYPDFSYTLEPAVADGAIFQFIDNVASVSFLIGRNFLAEGKRTYFINASHKGVSLFNEKFESLDYQLEVSFSKARFPLGISKITLMDESKEILAERLIFIKVESNEPIRIETDKQEYSKRSKVVTKVISNLPVGDSINSPPSVAIVNKDYLINGGYTQDMRSYLLLDSELKGPIESPASYFYDDEISSSDKLDLLLMVQGWRSYSWNDILENQPEDLQGWEDIGITLQGYVKRLFRKAPLPGAKVEVSPFSATWMFDWMYTDSLGQFRFDRLYLPDTMKIIINASTPRGGNNTEIILDPVMPLPVEVDPKSISDNLLDLEIPDEFYSESFYKLEAEKRYAIESGSVWLDEVEVITDIPEELDRSMGYYGFPDKTIVLTDEDRIYFNIFDYLESNPVAGVLVQGNTISIRGGGTPLFVVDGIIDEMGMFIDMPLGDIERIEVIKNSGGMAAFGSRGGNGIIAIYTRKGRINNTFEQYTWGRLELEIIGFHEPARFYSPKYTLENINDQKPDYRPTLYWNPNLEMKDGVASFEYFTSDFICEYVIILEGVTDKGKICTTIGGFSVTH